MPVKKLHKENSSYEYAKTCMGNMARVITKPNGGICTCTCISWVLYKGSLDLSRVQQLFTIMNNPVKYVSGIFSDGTYVT